MSERVALRQIRPQGCFGLLPGHHAPGVVRRRWTQPARRLGEEGGYCCQCVETGQSGDWCEFAAPYVLHGSEWRLWRQLPHDAARRKWMRGRVAAKDAVRELLMERHELVAPLETVLILPDRSGQPVVSFADALCGVSAILISISHCGDSSVALAAESNGRTRGIGIDVASTADDHDGLVEGGFGGRERALLKDGLVMGNTELLLRLWCAKEAVGKALGVGLMGDPLNYRIAGVAANRIEVAVETAVARSRAPRSDSSGMVTALVGQGRGMTYAVARIGW